MSRLNIPNNAEFGVLQQSQFIIQ